eukprot:gene644-biopygen9202
MQIHGSRVEIHDLRLINSAKIIYLMSWIGSMGLDRLHGSGSAPWTHGIHGSISSTESSDSQPSRRRLCISRSQARNQEASPDQFITGLEASKVKLTAKI